MWMLLIVDPLDGIMVSLTIISKYSRKIKVGLKGKFKSFRSKCLGFIVGANALFSSRSYP